MPDPNQTDPNQVNSAPQGNSVPAISPASDLPPLPPDFQTVEPTPSGSAAPSDLPPIVPPTPKKKFGGGKIIATILGLVLLVGGIGAGIILTQNQQLFQQKAAISQCFNDDDCSSNEYCLKLTTGNQCKTITNTTGTGPANCDPVANCGSKECGSNGCGGSCGSCASGKTCQSGRCVTATTTATPFCSDIVQQDCVNGCEPDTTGGHCKTTTPGSPVGGSCANGLSCATGLYCITATHTCSATGPGGTQGNVCSTANPCANGYNCVSGVCQANTSGGCKVGDSGAPVCCTDPTCAGGEKVCEAPNRLECKNASGTHCTISVNGCTGTPPPGGNNPTASCQNIKAYNSSYVALTSAQLSALTPGTSINFCVVGAASSGTFDKAKFTINGVAQTETTTHRPGAQDYCQAYEIPTGVTTFNISSQIHHATLGWK